MMRDGVQPDFKAGRSLEIEERFFWNLWGLFLE